MNHETKEVILKVTDVVKTVVHFGFIPFDSPGKKSNNSQVRFEGNKKRLKRGTITATTTCIKTTAGDITSTDRIHG
ncbi:hypothetical protein BGZ47_006193 [Haplosporangium gracile]|nr:hypothetical protein BGZ47_006193 [Haplosporangium gracile]